MARYEILVPITDESGRFLARRLICRVWNEDEFAQERQNALAAFEAQRRGAGFGLVHSPTGSSSNFGFGTRPQSPSPRDANGESYAAPRNSARSLANDMAKRFSGKGSKFSGSSDESWEEYLIQYQRAAKELELTNDLKVSLFHHLLSDHAMTFYNDEIEGKVRAFHEIITIMSKQFNSDARMEATVDRLRCLHLSEFEREGLSESTALIELAKEIQRLVPQAPKECRTDRFRRTTLIDATRGRDWALSVTSATHSRNFSHLQLLHEMHNSLQLHQAHARYSKGDSSDIVSYRKSRVSDINFAG